MTAGATLSTTMTGFLIEHVGTRVAFLCLAGAASLGYLLVLHTLQETWDKNSVTARSSPVESAACPSAIGSEKLLHIYDELDETRKQELLEFTIEWAEPRGAWCLTRPCLHNNIRRRRRQQMISNAQYVRLGTTLSRPPGCGVAVAMQRLSGWQPGRQYPKVDARP
jgi:hypothetical protein